MLIRFDPRDFLAHGCDVQQMGQDVWFRCPRKCVTPPSAEVCVLPPKFGTGFSAKWRAYDPDSNASILRWCRPRWKKLRWRESR